MPLFAVREMFRPADDTIWTVQERAEMALVRGALLPVVRLYRRFRVEPRSKIPRTGVLVVAEVEGQRFCLLVDELIGKQEVVIKSPGRNLQGCLRSRRRSHSGRRPGRADSGSRAALREREARAEPLPPWKSAPGERRGEAAGRRNSTRSANWPIATFGLDLKAGKEELVSARLRSLVRKAGGFRCFEEYYRQSSARTAPASRCWR